VCWRLNLDFRFDKFHNLFCESEGGCYNTCNVVKSRKCKWIAVITTTKPVMKFSHIIAIDAGNGPLCCHDIITSLCYQLAWASTEIFPGGAKLTFCLSFTGCWRCIINWMFTKCFTLATPQRECPVLRQQSQNCSSLVAMLFYSHFFSHALKLRGIPLATVTVSPHYLPRRLHSTVTAAKRLLP